MGDGVAGQGGAPVALDPLEPLRQLGVVVGHVHDRRQARLGVRRPGVGAEEHVGLRHAVVGEPAHPVGVRQHAHLVHVPDRGTPAARRAAAPNSTSRPSSSDNAPSAARARPVSHERGRRRASSVVGTVPSAGSGSLAGDGREDRRPGQRRPPPHEGDHRMGVAQGQPRDRRATRNPTAATSRPRHLEPGRHDEGERGDAGRLGEDRPLPHGDRRGQREGDRRRRRGHDAASGPPRPWPPRRTAPPSTAPPSPPAGRRSARPSPPTTLSARGTPRAGARPTARCSSTPAPRGSRKSAESPRSGIATTDLPRSHRGPDHDGGEERHRTAGRQRPTTGACVRRGARPRRRAHGPAPTGSALLARLRASPRSTPIHRRDRTEAPGPRPVTAGRRDRRGGRPRG